MADMEGIADKNTTQEFIDSCMIASEHAHTIEKAIMTVAAVIARPGDWQIRGETVQLSTVGSERFLKHFPIEFDDLVSFRQDYEDENGPAYRWVYQMRASMNGRVVFAEGRCSSADFVNNDEEAKEEDAVDEGGVMGASLAMAQSSGIKALLGLRKVQAVALFKALKEVDIDVEKFKLSCSKPDQPQGKKPKKGVTK